MKISVYSLISLCTVTATPYLHLQNDPTSWSRSKPSSPIAASAIIEEQVGAWNVYSHSSFPGYSVRVGTQQSKLCDDTVGQKVGYLDADGKHFFFWFFESRSKPADDPLILWLNGGPGCSSLTGLLMELGPCRVNPSGNGTTFNPYSWNTNANVIFLDQPVEVGFSYSDDSKFPTNSVDAAKDVYVFLQIFLNKWNQFADNDFHVTGESYAGHYIPAIGKEISDANKRHVKNKSIIPIKLISLAIGNGLTDPYNQYGSYPDMACDEKYGPFLTPEQCDKMRSQFPSCQKLIGSCYDRGSPFSCVPAAMYCNNVMISPFQKTGRNVYDVRKTCDVQKNPLCYDIANDIEAYLNDRKIQDALGVDRKYKGCDMNINLKFLLAGDWMKPYVKNVPALLHEGVKVLIYAGDADYICNWKGNKRWVHELEWKYKKGFNAANDTLWTSKITGRPLGELKSYKNFAFLRVFEAGHMVPYDQPEHANEFINWWINKKNFE